MDCLVIGTNLAQRMKNLMMTIESIDKLKMSFNTKVLSIDMFEENKTNPTLNIGDCSELESYCKANNWVLSMHKKFGMCGNIMNGLNHITSKYFLYSEDDVIINSVPSLIDIYVHENLDNKTLGWIGLATGGWNRNMRVEFAEKLNKKDKVYELNKDYMFMEQEQRFRDDYFVAFPVVIFNSSIFKELIARVKKNHQMVQIENGLTREWLIFNSNSEYYKLMYLKNIYNLFKPDDFKVEKVYDIMDENIAITHNRSQQCGALWDYWFHD